MREEILLLLMLLPLITNGVSILAGVSLMFILRILRRRKTAKEATK